MTDAAQRRAGLAAQLERSFGFPAGEADYLCNLGLRRGFLYVEAPKVACSTIKRTLQLFEGGAQSLPDNVHDKARSPLHGVLSSGWTFADIFGSAKLFRFAFVRNPFARILSCYLEKIVADPVERARHQAQLGIAGEAPVSLRGFLQAIAGIADGRRDLHWRSQYGLLNDSRISYHFIGRFEHLRRDLAYVLQSLGAPDPGPAIQDVRHHETGAGRRLEEFFGPEERDLVIRIYGADFLRYGYPTCLPGRSGNA